MIETVFDEWVREAEQKILVSGDYPLIDSVKIDMSNELWTVATHVVEEYPGEVSHVNASQIEPTIEVLEVRLISSDQALPVRFVILNFLYRLAHFGGFVSKSSASELKGAPAGCSMGPVAPGKISVLMAVNSPRSSRIRAWRRSSGSMYEPLRFLADQRAVAISIRARSEYHSNMCLLCVRDEVRQQAELV